jgi:hypothetical protein
MGVKVDYRGLDERREKIPQFLLRLDFSLFRLMTALKNLTITIFWNRLPDSEEEDWWYMPSHLESDIRNSKLFGTETKRLKSFDLHIDKSLGGGRERDRVLRLSNETRGDKRVFKKSDMEKKN